MTVSSMCMQVKELTVRDREKLLHLLGYLKRMVGQVLTL